MYVLGLNAVQKPLGNEKIEFHVHHLCMCGMIDAYFQYVVFPSMYDIDMQYPKSCHKLDFKLSENGIHFLKP